MTKLLYIPSGDYITFSTNQYKNNNTTERIRTAIYEESAYIYTISEVIDSLCTSTAHSNLYKNNTFLDMYIKYTLSEFEVIYD